MIANKIPPTPKVYTQPQINYFAQQLYLQP
jgi:hypothetical protein